MKIACKVEVQPTPKQRSLLLRSAGTARWAYNWGLGKHKAAYTEWVKQGKPKGYAWPSPISLHKELNALKKVPEADGGVPWMYEVSKCAPQEALRDLGAAFKRFLNPKLPAKYPRFKSRHRGAGGFRVTGAVRATSRYVQIPRLGRVRIKPGDHGYMPQQVYSQASVTESAGRWYASVVHDVDEAAGSDGVSVGLDLGVAVLATLSDGTRIENPGAIQAAERGLRRAQRRLSRKTKGSRNRAKCRQALARKHVRARNVRQDSLHKATTAITKRYGRCVIEDLAVANMTRSARGKGRAAKAGLNRSLLDAGFGEFRRQLEYKGRLYGCEIVAVPPTYTSQRCSKCGWVDAGSRRSQSGFECVRCGFSANADLNAAINIHVAGSCPETENACGGSVRRTALAPLAVAVEAGIGVGHV